MSGEGGRLDSRSCLGMGILQKTLEDASCRSARGRWPQRAAESPRSLCRNRRMAVRQMSGQPGERKAAWMSSRRPWRTVRRRNRFGQAKARSTARPGAGIDALAGGPDADAAITRHPSATRNVVGLAAVQRGGPLASPSGGLSDRRDGVDDPGELNQIVAAVGRMASGVPPRPTTRWRLMPGLPRSAGSGPVWRPPFCRDAGTVRAGAAPVDAVPRAKAIRQRAVETIPDARLLPVPQAPPADHPQPAAELPRRNLPGNAALEHEDDAGRTGAIGRRRSSDRSIDRKHVTNDSGDPRGQPPGPPRPRLPVHKHDRTERIPKGRLVAPPTRSSPPQPKAPRLDRGDSRHRVETGLSRATRSVKTRCLVRLAKESRNAMEPWMQNTPLFSSRRRCAEHGQRTD